MRAYIFTDQMVLTWTYRATAAYKLSLGIKSSSYNICEGKVGTLY